MKGINSKKEDLQIEIPMENAYFSIFYERNDCCARVLAFI